MIGFSENGDFLGSLPCFYFPSPPPSLGCSFSPELQSFKRRTTPGLTLMSPKINTAKQIESKISSILLHLLLVTFLFLCSFLRHLHLSPGKTHNNYTIICLFFNNCTHTHTCCIVMHVPNTFKMILLVELKCQPYATWSDVNLSIHKVWHHIKAPSTAHIVRRRPETSDDVEG